MALKCDELTEALASWKYEIDGARARVSTRFIYAPLPWNTTPSDILSWFDARADVDLFYFYDPHLERHILGIDGLARCDSSSENPSEDLQAFVLSLEVGCTTTWKPLLLGGLAFSARQKLSGVWREWPRGTLVLPRLLLAWTDDCPVEAYLGDDGMASMSVDALWEMVTGLALPVDQPSSPVVGATEPLLDDEKSHGEKVRRAVHAIQSGTFKKVVLARSASVEARNKVEDALRQLRREYQGNFLFAFRQKRTIFLGSTPEQLVRVQNGTIHVDALAGTERRGQTVEEDERLGKSLLTSGKNVREHAAVVDWLATELFDVVENFQVKAEPELLKLANVQHLYTPITARLRPGISVLNLVHILHPTPAVAGSPRAESMDFLALEEGLERGWYAGPIGWMTIGGDGSFAVALRSGLLADGVATLYAGGGIMAESNPETEWVETELKLQALMRAFGVRGEVQ